MVGVAYVIASVRRGARPGCGQTLRRWRHRHWPWKPRKNAIVTREAYCLKTKRIDEAEGILINIPLGTYAPV